jgi:hypothetical protein
LNISATSRRDAPLSTASTARSRKSVEYGFGMLDPARPVFIDETATSTNMVRVRGRCLRGERLVASVPHGHWKTITFVAGLRHDGIVAPFVIDGAMNGPAYIEQCLAPTLGRRDIVIMDNLPSHKVAGVVEAIEAARARVLGAAEAGDWAEALRAKLDPFGLGDAICVEVMSEVPKLLRSCA